MVAAYRRTCAGFLFVLLLGACVASAPASHDPARARLVTEDIPRFWAAFDARGRIGTVKALDSLYLEPGTRGLREWKRKRLDDAATMAQTVDGAARYYESARASTLRADAEMPRIRDAFDKLARLYPAATFPDVYFVIGRLSSGGTPSGAGLLIGVEMFGRTNAEIVSRMSPWLQQVLRPIEDLPGIVAHELIHHQQPGRGGSSLLARAVREGSADFIGEMISGLNINAHVHAWVAAEPGRERALWAEFEPRMHGRDDTGWFSTENPNTRPKDLGYYLGYRIAQAYYQKMDDKTQALRDIIMTRNADEFLGKSGYATMMRQ